ncbi:hypothetical protein TRFO_11861 [Tritrichomonas foetus]|uniref:Right handed beta helix domain-containing protein n=1 Tax=Tritrichomonas foetus TaxID=1144522 RepID=A0A1J4J872_9EUKA|nr:hypothetical protein TRFO_11861 [Tritrichomonas foetus]|eukprot:OHS93428.1 hypothetical protein TRFO_11861 [Tritrichomonas foetus]
MNFTIYSLAVSSLSTSPLFSSQRKLSIIQSRFSKFVKSAVFNIHQTDLFISRAAFYHFQHTPIYITQNELSGIYITPLIFTNNETITITRSIFYKCIGRTNSGGAILYSKVNGKMSLNHTVFQECRSYMRGGGFFFKGGQIILDSVSIVSSNAALAHAADIATDSIFTENGVCIYQCSSESDTRNGPTIRLADIFFDDTSYVKYLNASYNHIKSSEKTGIFLNENCYTLSIYFSTFFENFCGSEIQFKGVWYPYLYNSNLVKNHLSYAVFYLSDCESLEVKSCFIGNDYHVSFVLPATPKPTETPMETLLPIPTPPPPPILGNEPLSNRFIQSWLNQDSVVQDQFIHHEKEYNKYIKDRKIQEQYIHNRIMQNRNKYNNYNNKNNLLISEEEIKLVIYDKPPEYLTVFFSDCKIGYGYDEAMSIVCDDQCYISRFETHQLEKFYPTLKTNEITPTKSTEPNAFIIPSFLESIIFIVIIILIAIALISIILIKKLIPVKKYQMIEKDKTRKSQNQNLV